MHVGVCAVGAAEFYKALGTDEDGWPHFERIAEIPASTGTELLMKRALVEYFAAWIAGE